MLQGVLNRFRVRLGASPSGADVTPRVEPNIGIGPANGAVMPTVRATAASPKPAIIGYGKPESDCTEQRPAATVMPIIGTKHGRGHEYAEAFAAQFLVWLADRPEAAAMLPDEVITHLAANRFAPAVGMPMPPPRNLLSALKRSPGVRVKPNVRVRDARGDVIGKTTMYMLLAEPPAPSLMAA